MKMKLREIEEREHKNEKTNQKKHEYFMVIEKSYRELCQQVGIDPVHSAAAKRNASMDPAIKGNNTSRVESRNSPLSRNLNIRSDASLRSLKKVRPNEDLAVKGGVIIIFLIVDKYCGYSTRKINSWSCKTR